VSGEERGTAGEPDRQETSACCDHRAHEPYRLVVENLAQVIFQTDARGQWTYLNPAWTEMTGFDVDSSLGRCFLDYVHPEDRQRHADLLQPLVDRARDYVGREVRYVTKIGTVRWVEVRAQPITDGTRIAGTAGTLTDVTERKHAEEALTGTRARLSHLLISSPAIIYSRDVEPGFVFTFVSDNVTRQLGLPTHELLDDPASWAEHLHPDEAWSEREAFAQLVDQQHQSREYRFRHADGTYRWIHDERTVVRDTLGRPTEIVGSWVDVTARRRAEEASAQLEQELRHAQKLEAVGRLAGGVAHDFNNLLTVIIGRCELLFRRVGHAGATARDVDIIMATARRASTLTTQLLAFSRKQVLQPTLLDLNEVVANMERLLDRLIGEDVVLWTDLQASLGRARADLGQIEQVIMNLVVNARDAMPAGGRLTIQTANVDVDAEFAARRVGFAPGAYVMLAVSDTGVGIEPDVRAKLFEPFFTTKPEGKGTGLGLSTVYGIVKQSGGEIVVESEPGQGASFRIYLPRVDGAEPAPAVRPDGAPDPGGSETILLTEDAAVVRDLTCDLLRAAGYRVLAAATPDEALALCENHSGTIDLLLTDVVLPGMSGRELAEHARRVRPKMRVLFVSGYPDDEMVRLGIQREEAVFLAKPFTADALGRKVRQALERSAPPA
jgi:PAS domain S-box-containing protein